MANIIDGKAVSAKVKEQVRIETEARYPAGSGSCDRRQ